MSTTHTNPALQLVDSNELMTLLSIGRTTFYKLIKLPEFPAAIQLLSGGDYFWLVEEVRAYLEIRRLRPGRDRGTDAEPDGEPTDPADALVERSAGSRRDRRSSKADQLVPLGGAR